MVFADCTFVFIGNASKYVARGGLQSAGVKKFIIYSIQVTVCNTIFTQTNLIITVLTAIRILI